MVGYHQRPRGLHLLWAWGGVVHTGDVSTQTGSLLPDPEILTCHEYINTKEGYTVSAAPTRLPSAIAAAAFVAALTLLVCG